MDKIFVCMETIELANGNFNSSNCGIRNINMMEEVNEFKLWLYKEYPDKFIDIDITLLYKLFKKLKQ